MSAQYRLIQYMPDPFTRTKVTVGALVRWNGQVRVATADALPGPQCLGGRSAWVNVRMILDAIGASENFELPSGDVSALALIGEVESVPRSVDDPVHWVRKAVLPQSESLQGTEPVTPRRPRRDTLGERFLEQWHVAKFVESRFDAQKELGETAPVAHKITHWVPGSHQVLLMEPIVGNRPSLEQDLKLISESFLAHQRLFQKVGSKRSPTCIAYVIPNGYGGAVGDVSARLQQSADLVVNVDDPPQRRDFVNRIMTVAKSLPHQTTLIQ